MTWFQTLVARTPGSLSAGVVEYCVDFCLMCLVWQIILLTGRGRKLDLQLLSQCGSTLNCLSRSVPEIHSHVAGTLSNQQSKTKQSTKKKKTSLAARDTSHGHMIRRPLSKQATSQQTVSGRAMQWGVIPVTHYDKSEGRPSQRGGA